MRVRMETDATFNAFRVEDPRRCAIWLRKEADVNGCDHGTAFFCIRSGPASVRGRSVGPHDFVVRFAAGCEMERESGIEGRGD